MSHTALTPTLIAAIIELQSLPGLSSFALAGGNNLAYRFDHRTSVDIDLFSSQVIGISGFDNMQQELLQYYGQRLINCELIDPGMGEQYPFLRAFISKEDTIIKVEIIQNIALADPFEYIDGIRMLTLKDIGLLKLTSACSRKAKKDIYDLDLITDQIPLPELFALLEEKRSRFHAKEFESLFDLDKKQHPTENIYLLLAFDDTSYHTLSSRPNPAHSNIDILAASKTWPAARTSWRRKVMGLLRSRGLQPPPVRPVN